MVDARKNTKPTGDEERARRQAAVDFARTSVRLEGLTLDPDIEELYARYVNGDLTDAELTEAIKVAVGVA